MIIDSTTLWLAILCAVILVCAVFFFIRHLRINVLNPTGKGEWKKCNRTLSRFALLRRYKVLDHVELRLGGERIVVENMLVGCFGILLVETMGMRGSYYGTASAPQWTLAKDDFHKESFPNPLLTQQRQIAALRELFAEKAIYKVPIEGVVVFTNKSNKTEVLVSGVSNLLMPGKLGGYLQQDRFEKDLGVDEEKLCALLTGTGNTPRHLPR